MRRSEPLVFESGGWEINLAKRELRNGGVTTPIGSRAFDIIETLVRSAGDLVTKDDLMAAVWPGAIVEDNTVQVHISAIRKALGADRGMLQTVAGRGYRLLGDWVVRQGIETTEASPTQGAEVADEAQTNIPVAASALIGRETAVQQLRDLLSAYRVVTLTGPGGIGKTVLASEVARRMFPTLGGDVFLVELASLADPALVPSAVAYALNVRLRGDETSPESVARAIGGMRTLVVLDNCEHVIGAAAAMAESLVRLCPRVSLLATSREVLRIEGETVYHVPPLDVPAQHLPDAETVLEHSAAQLFIARTRLQRADFSAHEENLPAIAAICRQLDGIPLAIEFAAARAATLGVRQVAGHLDDRFSLLTSGRRTALARHQTLRATLDWSYELLSEREKRLLRCIAVFPAGFTLEAATAVADDSEPATALGISDLVLKSMVSLDGSATGRRWRLLETIRMYALEKLTNCDEHPQIVRRHAEYFLALFTKAKVAHSTLDGLNFYRREVDNLRAALTWALSPDGDGALGVALAAAASDFWVAASLVAESYEWASKALARIGEAGEPHHEMVLQCSLGFALIYTRGMNAPAREAMMRALTMARELSDHDYLQRTTCGLWLFSSRSMAMDDALAFARDYEEDARLRDPHSQATAAWLVGVQLTYMAEHVEASERLQWALEHYPAERRSQDMVRFGGDLRASAMGHNTVNLLSRGLLEAAARDAMAAVEEARSTNQPTVLCVALAWAAGFVFLSLDDLDMANDCGEELVGHAYKHALRPYHAVGLCVRGTLAVRRGDPALGVRLIRDGLARMQEATYLLFSPFFQVELAVALNAAGRAKAALEEIDEALRGAVETKYRWYVPEILRTKGELLALQDSEDPALIEQLFRQSLAQAAAQQALYWELSAAISLARFLRTQHKTSEARTVLSSPYDRFAEGFSAPRVKQAKALLDHLAG